MYDKDGRCLPASGLHADLPKEVFELKKIFPSVDIDALVTALAVSDNNVDTAKTVSRCCNIMLNFTHATDLNCIEHCTWCQLQLKVRFASFWVL